MKHIIWTSTLLLLTTSPVLATQNSCERLKSKIEQQIIRNGVPESDFTLTIVPSDRLQNTRGQVVGHCANDTQKILYIRQSDSSAAETDEAVSP
ncbi:DUF1161 domain-containing protein [Erwinia sp. HR93]|uniref:DUF1161 domain-containing protein n=1 Tax=Erwinia sp. HR93 TaxID=3094840 RepID=UPI002ADED9D3|nr:DUF1161 domain-containing protein [Erwinia sp. HR93]MEA1065046.1 DUF1161 domain-containing protein [Erwinia sp. HR93]